VVGEQGVARIVTSITYKNDKRRARPSPAPLPEGHCVRQPIEILPWALLSIAALVLSGTAADALRKGVTRPDLQAFDAALGPDGCGADNTACASKATRRYVLAADAFALDSAELPHELKRPLDAVADALREQGASAVRVEVHTDASGPHEARRTLTQRRAEAIKAYLIERGIDATTLHAVGMGSSVPRHVADPFAAGNRRIEIVRL